MSSKKNAKKPSKKRKKTVKVARYNPGIDIELTPEIEEILKSNEAKLYIKGIERASQKLRAMIERELQLRKHPGHAGTT